MADECRYCHTRLTSKKSIALGVGPECANKYQPFVTCQLCQSEEDDLAKKQNRPFNWDNVTKYTHIEGVPKRLYCRKRSPDKTIHGDNFGTWEDFPNCANATDDDWDEHLNWLTWDSYGGDEVLCGKCKEDE